MDVNIFSHFPLVISSSLLLSTVLEIMCFWSWTRICSINLHPQISFYSQSIKQPIESWLFVTSLSENKSTPNTTLPHPRVLEWNTGCFPNGTGRKLSNLNCTELGVRTCFALGGCWCARRASHALCLSSDADEWVLLSVLEQGLWHWKPMCSYRALTLRAESKVGN